MIAQATAFQLVRFTPERPLITIEFAPDIHPGETEYQYEHPKFVFGDRVILVNEYPETEFTVCALELIESKTPSRRLLNQPRWKYKISNGEISYWKEESALTRFQNKSSPDTCLTCPEFNNYQDNYGRGWCRQFNHQARTHHIRTNDCVLSINEVEAFPSEVIELDRDGYPMYEAAPTGYFATNFVTNPNEPF